MFSSKAETLSALSKRKLIFKIPNLNYYTYKDWKINKKKILNSIQKNYNNKLIALRSSAIDEDNLNNSNAGKYKSFLNIRFSNKQVEKKINEIFNSYRKFRPIKNNDKFIVQEMVNNLSVSGVLFTKDLETQSDYYVVNYDDETGSTDRVTSGKGEFSNRSLYIKRDKTKYLKSERFKLLINSVKNLEKNLNNENLDIEFAIDTNLNTYLLQVREIKNLKSPIKLKKKIINIELNKVSNKIKKYQEKDYPSYSGKFTYFGNMPDWNPAEIIGNQPNDLAFSLYNYFISKNTWVKARNIIGYKKNRLENLIVKFGGRPYVNINLSLNSFLPKGLLKKSYDKIVDHWLLKLKLEPYNHDKIEFNIATTCYDFTIKDKLKTQFPKKINKLEKKKYLNNLKKLTVGIILEKNGFASLSNQISQIKKLEKIFLKKDNLNSPLNYSREIQKKMKICRDIGLLSFSILARYAFISISLINSLVELNILSEKKKNLFLKSIDNITSEFLKDSTDLKKRKIDKKTYFKKYGHLRPGTYNLTSKKYEKLNFNEFRNQKFTKTLSKFQLDGNSKNKIDKLLKLNNFKGINFEKLFSFFTNSIKWREKGKFIYTKYVSYILDLVEAYGEQYKINKRDLVYVNIEQILKIEKKKISKVKKKKELLGIILKNKHKFIINSRIKLPQLIYDESAPFIIPHIVSSPNFVTKKIITGKIIFLRDDDSFKIDIHNKIVLTENADPGFDWIFQKKIKALITKYGGANSHMTIRCAELDIPAAIGIGDKKFDELLKTKNQIDLDCSTKNINLF